MASRLTIAVTVNGEPHDLTVDTATTLLDMLRWSLDLTGAKKCCAVAECGACTVLLDGRSVNACLVMAVEVDGSAVTTVEGLGTPGALDPVQEAFLDAGAVQCGFCIPGMIVSARQLLQDHPEPTTEQIRDGLSGNLCRCAGYNQIVRAVAAAAVAERGRS